MSEQQTNRAVGRRKTAIARVRLTPGDGRIMINDKTPLQYLGRRALEIEVIQPLRVTERLRRFDVNVEIHASPAEVSAGEAAIAKIQAGRQPKIFDQPQPDWCA